MVGGDAAVLPQAQFVSKFILSKDELLIVDGEGLHSCCNLFSLPVVWHGYMALEKHVPSSVFGHTRGRFNISCSHVGADGLDCWC